MRVGEYAWSNGWDCDEVLRGADLVARKDGRPTASFGEADVVMLRFKASKADQLKAGEARKHYKTEDVGGLCLA